MASTPQMKVLIVESAPFIRLGIVSFIKARNEWYVCGAAGDGKAAKNLWKPHVPDLIVIGFALEGGDCLALIAEWRKVKPSSICIVLGREEDPAIVQRIFAAGPRLRALPR